MESTNHLSMGSPKISLSGRQFLPSLTARADSLSPNQQLLPLTARVNTKDHLEIGGCDVVDMVNKFGSPLYILDEMTLRTGCRQYRDAFRRYYPGESQVLYASKAWNCLAVCAIAAGEGLGIDVVSGGELYTALQARIRPNMIYCRNSNVADSKKNDKLDFRQYYNWL